MWFKLLFCGLFSVGVISWANNAQSTKKSSISVPQQQSSLLPKTRFVVLDPGHGGNNPGATGTTGISEKHFTLTLTKKVAALLGKKGIPTRMTRSRDTYVTLRGRMDIANNAEASLFVSIHANASNSRSERGFETYALSSSGAYIDSASLRTTAMTDNLAAMTKDIQTSLVRKQSISFADIVQAELEAVLGSAGNRGTKQSNMHVLLGATMPSVLVEVGFIDHPIEGRLLLQDEHQNKIAFALAKAIETQLRSL